MPMHPPRLPRRLALAGLAAAAAAPPCVAAAQPPAPAPTSLLRRVQGLPTSGARAVESFSIGGALFLAVPQLAQDIPGAPANMQAGDSDVAMPVFRWEDGGFRPWSTLPVSGGEDAEFFRIGDRAFLATASLRTGRGPYEFDALSTIFEWRDGGFVPFQAIPTFAAKQWRHFRIGERHFLALAQGVTVPGLVPRRPSRSAVFAWDGAAFAPFQEVPSAWGYNWHHFRIDGADFLAYADQREPSVMLRWTGAAFETVQAMEGRAAAAARSASSRPRAPSISPSPTCRARTCCTGGTAAASSATKCWAARAGASSPRWSTAATATSCRSTSSPARRDRRIPPCAPWSTASRAGGWSRSRTSRPPGAWTRRSSPSGRTRSWRWRRA